LYFRNQSEYESFIHVKGKNAFPIKKYVCYFITEWKIQKPAVYLGFPQLDLTVRHTRHEYEVPFCIHHSETRKTNFPNAFVYTFVERYHCTDICGCTDGINTRPEKWMKNTSRFSSIYHGDICGEFMNLNIENLLENYLGWNFKAVICGRVSITCNSVVLSTWWIGSDNKFFCFLEMKRRTFIITRVPDT